MILPRREFLHLAAGAAALPAVSSILGAGLSESTVRIVVGFPAGQAIDIFARPMANVFSSGSGRHSLSNWRAPPPTRDRDGGPLPGWCTRRR